MPVGDIGRRKVDRVSTASITEVVHVEDALSWFLGALGELQAVLGAQRIAPTGPAGGMFSNAIFSHARGEATYSFPVTAPYVS